MDDYCKNFTIPENIVVNLDFSKNCTWLKNIIRNNYTEEDVWRDALPTYLYAPGGTSCYGDQYLSYFNSSENGARFSVPIGMLWGLDVPARLCIPQVCPSIGTTGNPDMAGIGMLAAYLFELTFVTVCYLSHILGPDAHKPKKSGGGSRKYDFLSSVVMTHDRAIKETMPSFLDAAAFFALSVGVATLVTALKNTNTYYEVVMLRHVSILSIGPLYAVLSFSYKTLRRKHLRSNIITITVILVFAGWWYAPSSRMWGGDKWTNFCFVGNTYIAISISTIEVSIIFTMTVSEGFGILLRLIRLVVKCCAPYSKYFAISSDNPSRSGIGRLCITLRDYSWGLVCPCFSGIFMFLRRYFFRWKLEGKSIWIVATFSLLVTWVEAAFVIFDRVRMQRQAGDAYQENLMGYGQVLAALIWVPVIVEYVYIAIFLVDWDKLSKRVWKDDYPYIIPLSPLQKEGKMVFLGPTSRPTTRNDSN